MAPGYPFTLCRKGKSLGKLLVGTDCDFAYLRAGRNTHDYVLHRQHAHDLLVTGVADVVGKLFPKCGPSDTEALQGGTEGEPGSMSLRNIMLQLWFSFRPTVCRLDCGIM